MQWEKHLTLFILFLSLVCAINCFPNEDENSAAENPALVFGQNAASASMHKATKRTTDDYIEYYAIQPRAGKQYPRYYTTVRCKQYYRKPGKRPQCLEDLPVKTQTVNGNILEVSRIDNDVTNKLDEKLYQQLPVTALPDVIRVPIHTVERQKPSKQFIFGSPIEYNTEPYQQNSVDFDAQIAELTDILEKAPRVKPTSLFDLIFPYFKQRRRIQEQIAATYLKHYGESR